MYNLDCEVLSCSLFCLRLALTEDTHLPGSPKKRGQCIFLLVTFKRRAQLSSSLCRILRWI